MKVAELEGAHLDYWVVMAGEVWTWAHELFPTMTLDPTFVGAKVTTYENGSSACTLIPHNPMRQDYVTFAPSRRWEHAGPIIDRERIMLEPVGKSGAWVAHVSFYDRSKWRCEEGSTPLVAAMRAYVASKFGDEVEGEVAP